MWPISVCTHGSICPVHFGDQNWFRLFLDGTCMSVCNMRTKRTCHGPRGLWQSWFIKVRGTTLTADLTLGATVLPLTCQEITHLSKCGIDFFCFKSKVTSLLDPSAASDQCAIIWLLSYEPQRPWGRPRASDAGNNRPWPSRGPKSGRFCCYW